MPRASRAPRASISKAGTLRAPFVRVSAPDWQASKIPMRTSKGACARRALTAAIASPLSPSRSCPSLAWPE
jgi:hypothetical protein